MIIENNDIGKRIDKYLGETTEYTRSKIQKMIENKNVLVNGKEVKSSYILKITRFSYSKVLRPQ